MRPARQLFNIAIVKAWTLGMKWSLILVVALPLIYLAGCGGGGGNPASDPGQPSSAPNVKTLAIALNSVRALVAANYVGRVVGQSFSPQTRPCEVSGTVEYLATNAVLSNCVMDIAPQVVMSGSGVAGAELGDFNGFVVTGEVLDIATGFTFINGVISNSNSTETATGYTNQTAMRDALVQLGSASNYDIESFSIDGVQIGFGTDATFGDLSVSGIVRHDGQRAIVSSPTPISWGLTNGGGPNGGSLEVANSEVVGPGYIYTFDASGQITYLSTDGDTGVVAWPDVRAEITATAQ